MTGNYQFLDIAILSIDQKYFPKIRYTTPISKKIESTLTIYRIEHQKIRIQSKKFSVLEDFHRK